MPNIVSLIFSVTNCEGLVIMFIGAATLFYGCRRRSGWAVEGSGGKRREIAVKMGFCGDMAGYAGCGAGSGAGGAAGGVLVVDRSRAEKLKRP